MVRLLTACKVDIWWPSVPLPHGNDTVVGTGIHPDYTSRRPQADRSLQHRSHVATHAQGSTSPVQGFTSAFPDNICCPYVGAIHRKAKEAGTPPVRLMQTSGWRVIIVVTTVLLAWSCTQVCCNTLAEHYLAYSSASTDVHLACCRAITLC